MRNPLRDPTSYEIMDLEHASRTPRGSASDLLHRFRAVLDDPLNYDATFKLGCFSKDEAAAVETELTPYEKTRCVVTWLEFPNRRS